MHHHPKPRVLFLLKQRGQPYAGNSAAASEWGNREFTGLGNSVRYVVHLLHLLGIEAKYAAVVDNNCIDREVHKYKPTHVIVEALWVVPDKFAVLTKLHPKVQWVVRLHSELPFMAQEGVALDWIFKYVQYPNVTVSANAPRFHSELSHVLHREIPYQPNYYPLGKANLRPHDFPWTPGQVDVGCYGAIRPLKNQLIQAVAAIEFADSLGLHLRFHMNACRVEMQAQNVLKNIRALFANSQHELIEDEWLNIDNFLHRCHHMDLGMQVSFSETFDLVAADLVSQGVPTVASPEVWWIDKSYQAEPTNTKSIVLHMHSLWNDPERAVRENMRGLERANHHAREAWLSYFGHST